MGSMYNNAHKGGWGPLREKHKLIILYAIINRVKRNKYKRQMYQTDTALTAELDITNSLYLCHSQ